MKKLLFLLTAVLLTVGACKKDSENSDTNKIEKINVQGTELSINSEIYKALISDNGAKYKVASNPNGRTSNSLELVLKSKNDNLSIHYRDSIVPFFQYLSDFSLPYSIIFEKIRTVATFSNFFIDDNNESQLMEYRISDTSYFHVINFNLTLDTAIITEIHNEDKYIEDKYHIFVFDKN